jgi:hypothetical protein
MLGSFRIKDISFEIDHQKSELLAFIPQESPGEQSEGHLRWSLEVYCVEKEYERSFWPPYLYAQEMRFDIQDWKAIEGRTVLGDGAEELRAFLYVQEHEPTAQNSISFISRRGNFLLVRWECLADVFWDDDYSTALPLRLEAEIPFNGVHIWWLKSDAQGLSEAKKLVGRHFDLDCLEQPQAAGPHHIVFPPRLDLKG